MSVLSNMRFGRIEDGCVRLTMNGKVAVRVGSDYKYYNEKKNQFINADNFVFEIGSDFFFVMPTNKVKRGDIVIIGGKPVYVLSAVEKKGGTFKVLSYEDGQIKELLPERHTFLGNTYMYSKIVSMFGNKAFDKNTIMKYMMFNTMMGGKGMSSLFGGSSSSGNGMNPMMLMMMMGGKNPMMDMFNFDDESDGLFGGLDFFGSEDDDSDEDEESEESETK